MAMRDHLTRVSKLRAQITSVDPANHIVDVIGADNGARRIMVWEVPSSFRWPVEGEAWSIYEENGNWYLGSRANEPTDTFPISGMQAGSMRLDSADISDSLGRSLSALFERVAFLESISVPLGGSIEWNAAGGDPAGGKFMIEDGRALNAVTDPTLAPLFAVILNTHGGTDNTNFRIPDSRGRASVGAGTGAGLVTRNVGDKFGVQAPTMPAHVTLVENQTHNHWQRLQRIFNIAAGVDVAAVDTGPANATGDYTGDQNQNHTHNVNGVGSATDGNVPPSIAKNKAIRVR